MGVALIAAALWALMLKKVEVLASGRGSPPPESSSKIDHTSQASKLGVGIDQGHCNGSDEVDGLGVEARRHERVGKDNSTISNGNGNPTKGRKEL